MPRLTFSQIAEMTSGDVVQHGDLGTSSVVIDSREVKADSVFFAIRDAVSAVGEHKVDPPLTAPATSEAILRAITAVQGG